MRILVEMKKLSLFIVLLFILMQSAFIARAQNVDYMVVRKELDDVREDIKILQRRNYAGREEGEAEVRFGQLDEIIRTTAGRLDELDFKIKQLDERINMINRDIDVRMSLLEGKPVKAGGGVSTDNSPKFAAPVANSAPKTLLGGEISRGDSLQPLKTPTAQDVYQKGLTALKAANYTEAEDSFNRILEKFSNDKLAGNAQYWLGETFYGRKDYSRAAVAFAKGYKNYRDNPKAADSLLKLGLSMKGLSKKQEACAALLSLPKEFPKAETVIKDRAKSEAAIMGCK